MDEKDLIGKLSQLPWQLDKQCQVLTVGMGCIEKNEYTFFISSKGLFAHSPTGDCIKINLQRVHDWAMERLTQEQDRAQHKLLIDNLIALSAKNPHPYRGG